ncbi:MAG TPA: hypothetical protein VK658_28435 [Chryseolinea sp.]|nr:hypothetical protein [Chryseolinea sp.]
MNTPSNEILGLLRTLKDRVDKIIRMGPNASQLSKGNYGQQLTEDIIEISCDPTLKPIGVEYYQKVISARIVVAMDTVEKVEDILEYWVDDISCIAENDDIEESGYIDSDLFKRKPLSLEEKQVWKTQLRGELDLYFSTLIDISNEVLPNKLKTNLKVGEVAALFRLFVEYDKQQKSDVHKLLHAEYSGKGKMRTLAFHIVNNIESAAGPISLESMYNNLTQKDYDYHKLFWEEKLESILESSLKDT